MEDKALPIYEADGHEYGHPIYCCPNKKCSIEVEELIEECPECKQKISW